MELCTACITVGDEGADNIVKYFFPFSLEKMR